MVSPKLQVLKSTQDDSVNFVETSDAPGSLEARYVRRHPHYVVGYLSSQRGCKMACRFCHLTQQGETYDQGATLDEYRTQAVRILEQYRASEKPADSIHWNFMARGEPFENPHFLEGAEAVLDMLASCADDYDLYSRWKISTIGTQEIANFAFTDIFKKLTPDLYYSLYSTNRQFRKRWLPKAIPVPEMLCKLADWQQRTAKIVKLHWCYIDGENDSLLDTENIVSEVLSVGLRVDVNIVRYNPYSASQGKESPEDVIRRNAQYLLENLPGSRVKVIPRIGQDVYASCGMFAEST